MTTQRRCSFASLLSRHSRAGFVLAASLGVLAVVFIMMVSINAATLAGVNQIKRDRNSRLAIETARSAAMHAAAVLAQSGKSEIAGENWKTGLRDCQAWAKRLDPGDPLYAEKKLAPAEGDAKVEVRSSIGEAATTSVWLANALSRPRRTVLLTKEP